MNVYGISLIVCYVAAERIERLCKDLPTKYKGNDIGLFYMVEQNPYLSGYHAHFLLLLDADDKTAII